jgi:hypothetical protein
MSCGNCGGVLKSGGSCGCTDCPPGTNGADGAAGDSAYQVWLDNGNVGTVDDFIQSLIGPQGPAGADGVDGVPNPKINFYNEFIGAVSVKDGLPDPTVYHFPVGYGLNTYTNGTGVTRDYLVTVSFDTTALKTNEAQAITWVDGAIIKTVAAVDNVEYESAPGLFNMNVSLYNGAGGGQKLDLSSTPIYVPDSTGTGKVEVRFAEVHVSRNVSFFKKVTLNDGESVSLKFKTFDSNTDSVLDRAQIVVVELD